MLRESNSPFLGLCVHSGRPLVKKTDFFHNLRQTLRQIPDAEIRLIFGDFNARLHYVLDDDRPQVGSHILGKGFGFLNNVSPNTLENRELFVDFLKSEDFWAMNTQFQKYSKSFGAFSEVSNTENGPPWDATRYAQIDYSLAPSRWKNISQNVEALPDVQIDSDHFLVVLSIKIKLKAMMKQRRNSRFKFRTPSLEQILHFNSALSQVCRPLSENDQEPLIWLREFNENILSIAKHSLSQLPHEQRKTYLSAEIWNLIELKRQYRLLGDQQAELETRKLVRHSARKDKEAHVIRSYENAQYAEDRWKSIRLARKKFVPFKNRRGEYIDFTQKAHAAADYLANVQWCCPEPCPPKFNPRPIIFDDLHLDDSEFTISELRSVLTKCKQNKAPGPDNIIADLLKLFDDQNLQPLLEQFRSSIRFGAC